MVYDRGKKKWATMMLAEHAHLLSELWEISEYKVRPDIDEQEKNLINENLKLALLVKEKVKIYYFSQGKIKHVSGFIQSINLNERWLSINHLELAFADISGVIFD